MHQLERKLRSHARHLLAELVLFALAGAEVAEHAELERAVLVGERQRQRRGAGFAAGAACCSGIAAGRAPRRARQAHRGRHANDEGEPGLLSRGVHRLAAIRYGQRLVDVVDDQLRVEIEQDEPLADEAVLEVLGQLRQRTQNLRRHVVERNAVGVAAVDPQLHPARVLLRDRLPDGPALRAGQRAGNLAAEVGTNRLR